MDITVRQNVYDTLKAISADRQIDDKDRQKLEQAIAMDGQVDGDEQVLLERLSTATWQSGGEELWVSPEGQADTVLDLYLDAENGLDDGYSTYVTADVKVSDVPAGKVSYDHRQQQLEAVKPTARETMVPEQDVGRQTDTEVKRYYYKEPELARANFATARERFLDINNWEKYADDSGTGLPVSAGFKLFDANGKAKQGPPQAGDQIRIDLPGPSGNDWVTIEEVSISDNELAIRVRAQGDNHWFTSEATNTFILRKQGDMVSFSVHGRNERVDSYNPLDHAKNKGGQWGLQKIQWESLGKGIVPPEGYNAKLEYDAQRIPEGA